MEARHNPGHGFLISLCVVPWQGHHLCCLSCPFLACTRLAHPGGCRIDQLNAELMMREAEQGAWGHCRGHSCSLSCSCQGGSSCPQACRGLPVCAMLQLPLPCQWPTSQRGTGGSSPWLQSSQLPPAPEVRGTRVLVPPQCALWEAVPALPDSRAQRVGAFCPWSHALGPGQHRRSQERDPSSVEKQLRVGAPQPGWVGTTSLGDVGWGTQHGAMGTSGDSALLPQTCPRC